MATPGLTFADIVAGQKRLLDQAAVQSSAQERMSTAQLKELIASEANLSKLTDLSQAADSRETTAVYTSEKDRASQEKANKNLEKMGKTLENGLIKKTGDGLNSNMIKVFKEVQQTRKLNQDEVKGILGKNAERREFKTISGRVGATVGGIKDNVKDFFSMRGFLDKTGIVKRGTGGWASDKLDAREDRQKYAKARIAAGDPTVRLHGVEGATKIFERQRGEQQELTRQQNVNQKKVDEYRKIGVSEKQIAKSPEAKALEEIAAKLAKVDPSLRPEGYNAKTGLVTEDNSAKVKPENKDKRTENYEQLKVSTAKYNTSDDGRIKSGPPGGNDLTEANIEQQEYQKENMQVLKEIAENTKPKQGAESVKPSSDGEGAGGILGGLGKGLGALGKGIGTGLGAILKGIGRGLMVLAEGLVALTPAIPVIAVLTVAAIGLGKALELAAPAIEAFAPVLMKIAEVIGGVFIEAIKSIPAVLGAIGGIITVVGDTIVKIMDTVVSSIEKLAAIDPLRLVALGGGLMAVAAGMAAFGGAQALAGVGSLVGKFLSGGGDGPVEQLIKLGESGPGVEKAAAGMDKISVAMKSFSKLDKKSMDVINDFPWLKATAFVAAGGAMSVDGSKVYNASKQNADKGAEVNGKKAGASAPVVVSAPTTINKTNQQGFFKTHIRNTEATVNQFYKSRFV
jgi:hypothetical protein